MQRLPQHGNDSLFALSHTPRLCNTVKGDEVYTGPTLVSLQGRRIPHLTWLHSCPIGEFHLTSYSRTVDLLR